MPVSLIEKTIFQDNLTKLILPCFVIELNDMISTERVYDKSVVCV